MCQLQLFRATSRAIACIAPGLLLPARRSFGAAAVMPASFLPLIAVNATLLLVACGLSMTANAATPGAGEVRDSGTLGQAVEQYRAAEEKHTPWVQDESDINASGDKLAMKKVVDKETKTVKLLNAIPPIYFASGKVDIPESYIKRLQSVLTSVKDKRNVRLHFVGNTDNVPLSKELQARYADNVALSRDRAGTVAEYFKEALKLPAESISWEGVGDAKPVASNDTAAGRAKNRRVEVEVWYDQVSGKLVNKEVVVRQNVKRVEVCRVQTVCKLRYKEGHDRRAQIRNLVSPLHYGLAETAIPNTFLEQLREALHDLADKQNVVVKFIGYTDNEPLTGRDARIYGSHLVLSKARARRVALAVQDALHLPSREIASDGMGAKDPVASNDTEKGRQLNRRIEVEFWYDDPLQQLPKEPQLCPASTATKTVTRVYEPASGAIDPVYFNGSQPIIPSGYSERLRRLMADVQGKSNVRLRFIGYIADERLSRRVAEVYGDDIGLSTARARRVMEIIKKDMSLKDNQVEYEGRGYVQTDDVVNSGFVESHRSRVVVQVVYDEKRVLDETAGMNITRMTREITPQNPYALNLMRISVDGKPVDDPKRSIADIQRCTDVALDKADIQFKFDDLKFTPRLNVTAWPATVRYQDDLKTKVHENRVRFRLYSNYMAFVSRAEIRLFEKGQSVRSTPLAVIPVNKDGEAAWDANFSDYQAPGREIDYVLRVYDKQGHFDETRPQRLWIVDKVDAKKLAAADAERELLVGYGESRLAIQNIPLTGGSIDVYGDSVPKDHSVWVAGRRVPTSKENKFVAEELLPPGAHPVPVARHDNAGNGELYLRDLYLNKHDWFTVGIADVTLSASRTKGPAKLLAGDTGHYDNNNGIDGRFAFFTDGKFGQNWKLTASADTREGPLKDIFSNFMNKSPDALFRRIDPDYYYPTYGDDSTVKEQAPTMGKFYVKLKKQNDYGMWGDFKTGYTDNTLARVDRSLYGADGHLESTATTSFGEHRFGFDAFAAEPGTVAGRDEFRGTGGSLYFLRHQDILSGSEQVRIEVRDVDSGMVVAVKNLTPALDYDIDYIQGRIVLTDPLSATAPNGMLVDSSTSGGNMAYLVVRYEYTPGFNQFNSLALGGQVHYWIGDHVKLGLTGNHDEDQGAPNNLSAGDFTVRKSAGTWAKLEYSRSRGPGVGTVLSSDGGYSFDSSQNQLPADSHAGAYRFESAVTLSDFVNLPGNLTFYRQSVDAGYSAPGLDTLNDTKQAGGTLSVAVSKHFNLRAKIDNRNQKAGLQTTAQEADVDYVLNDTWTLSTGVRRDNRKDHSADVPLTQVQGKRTDLRVKATYNSKSKWSSYGFVQNTMTRTGNRDKNGMVGAGGSYRMSDRFKLKGEVSQGDIGTNARLGSEYLYTDRTTLDLNYTLENERTDNGVRARKGNLTSGFRTRFSDSASVFMQEQYTNGDVPTGLTHTAGIDIAPTDHWNYGLSLDKGSLRDHNSGAKTDREAMSVKVGYNVKAFTFASVVEFRVDKDEQPDTTFSKRTTWLAKNSLKYQVSPNWRLIAKYDRSNSTSTQGEFYDGNYTEAVVGYAYRPVTNDRINALVKYTWFYNLPSADQVTLDNTAAQYIQKTHIVSTDITWDMTDHWSLGAKYAIRLGQLSQDRVNPQFLESRAQLYVLRADWHLVRRWDLLLEGRVLNLPDAKDRRSGFLTGLYRHLGNNLKLGVGYNFTAFSDDLTDYSYNSRGVFVNVVGKI